MLIKLPKKLKELISLRGTEMIMEASNMEVELETPKAIRWLLTKATYKRCERYCALIDDVDKAYAIVDSIRDIPLISDVLTVMTLSEYLSSDINTEYEDDLLALFKDEEHGVWVLEHLSGERLF